jgi:hypothetical protein
MCPHEEKLTAWLLGDLPPEEHQALTRHLETCASCRSVREELSSVLTPLRSGLEKDRHLSVGPLPIKTTPRPGIRWLWSAPHEGLRRAAILTLSFGTFFAILSMVYQGAQRKPHDAKAVTHLTFLRSDEKPAPALVPVKAVGGATAAKDALAESEPNPEPFTTPTAPVAHPAAPAPDYSAPAFRTLAKAAPAPTAPAETAAPAPSYPAQAVAKRERGKAPSAASIPRPPPDLVTKPVRLAGIPPPALVAPTNAVPTNAVPTNAVMPTLKAKP